MIRRAKQDGWYGYRKVTALLRIEVWRMCCQTNAQSSLFRQRGGLLSGQKPTPLDESGSAALLATGAIYATAILIEVIENRGVEGGEFLQTSHVSEPLHSALFWSEWLM